MKLPSLLVRAGLLLAMGVAAYGQSTVGTIYGSVSDPSGSKLANAVITITDVKTQLTQTSKSNGKGDFQFVSVQPSNYTVTATVDGFKTETQTGVTVDANANVNVSFTLQVGAKDESVEVTAGTTLVDTREAQIGETIDEQRIEELPTVNRDPYQLLQSVTGVSGFSPDTLIGSRDGARFSVNGMPVGQSSFYLDGAQNNILRAGGGNKAPNPSMLQEFRILTSNFDAEFGRSPGAVVNLITKSGSDRYHGEVYEFIRNDALDALPFSYGPLPADFPVNYKLNQFGGSVGGPMPKLSKTYFFFGFEQLNLHQLAYVLPTQYRAPQAAFANGDFSTDYGTDGTFTPTSSLLTYSCNGTSYVICPNNIDPVAVAVMKFLPKRDPVTGISPTQSAQAPNLVNQGLGRIDYKGFNRHSITGTFFDSRGSAIDPTVNGTNQAFAYEQVYENNNQVNGILADTWVVSNNAVNDLRGFYTGNRSVITNFYPDHLAPDLGATYPIGGARINTAPPRFALGTNSWMQIGPQTYGPSDVNQQSFGLVDVATLTFGQHTIKVGGSYIWDKYSEIGTNYAGGAFSITSDIAGVGDRYSDFMLGHANSFEQSTVGVIKRHNYDPSLFAQDTWHVLPRLTLNLGARWEVFSPYYGDRTSGSFRAGVQSVRFPTAPLGILYEGDPGVATGVANTPYTDFAPRLGFAWDLYGDGRTSLRGGWGVFFYQQVIQDENRYQMPFGLDLTLQPGAPGVQSFVNPYPSGGGPTVSPFPYNPNPANPVYIQGGLVYATPPNGGSTPYANEYNLSVEQQLTKTYALRVSYVGSSYVKQFQSVDINSSIDPSLTYFDYTYHPVTQTNPVAFTSETNSVPNFNLRRPYEPYGVNGFGDPVAGRNFYFQKITELQNNWNTSYNSLQVTLRGRLGRQINLNSSYVWSKALDNESPVNRYDLRSSYGPTSVDVRNRWVISALIGIPGTRKFGFVGKQLLSGWRVNTLTYVQSGTPFTVTTSTDENFDGNTGDRPDQVMLNPYNTKAHTDIEKINEYLNPNAFANTSASYSTTTTPAGTAVNNAFHPNADPYPQILYGSESRNSLRLPGTSQTNLSLFKEFALPAHTRLQLRAEAFNALNKVNFLTPRTDLTTIKSGIGNSLANYAPVAGFASITTFGTMRQLQFGARLMF